jgi:hypothetical protein
MMPVRYLNHWPSPIVLLGLDHHFNAGKLGAASPQEYKCQKGAKGD